MQLHKLLSITGGTSFVLGLGGLAGAITWGTGWATSIKMCIRDRLTVMGGGHSADAPVMEIIQYGDGKRCAFRGIGARSQLCLLYTSVFFNIIC